MTSFPLSLTKALRIGWEAWKRQWWILPAILVFSGFISSTPQAMEDAGVSDMLSTPVAIVTLVLSIVLEIGIVYIVLGMHEGKKMRFSDVFSQYRLAFRYFCAYVLFLLVILSGVLLAAVLTGVSEYYGLYGKRGVALGLMGLAVSVFVYFGLRLQFYSYVLVDRRLGIIESLRASWRLTRGHSLELFSFWLLLLLVNVLGLMALIVGFFVSVSVSMLAFADVYRQLSGMQEDYVQGGETPASASLVNHEEVEDTD